MVFGFFKQLLLGYMLVVAGCSSDQPSRQDDEKADVVPRQEAPKKPNKEVGEASWYGPGFQGQKTSSGETFDQKKMTAAHPTLPMGTKATVTNQDNGKQVEVTINDRGPTVNNRVIGLSSGAANKLDMKKDGTAQVTIETKPKAKKGARAKIKLIEPDDLDE
ncbi:septal ring lytic transglycosylase RlpA family protein [Methylomonas koyamae]|uniref:septal ring lytic transglycosylase RlpA family protein n=1 Tax=Methylomonas koyamae TaxID=702114 RepID=UPI000BC308C8|nr:septal ring lytic transglycosylase RlpA family protein [Methylomonas koyamae]ATG90153.1 hypothetical protein MKLM6_1921 [Methylomonas koyamae]